MFCQEIPWFYVGEVVGIWAKSIQGSLVCTTRLGLKLYSIDHITNVGRRLGKAGGGTVLSLTDWVVL